MPTIPGFSQIFFIFIAKLGWTYIHILGFIDFFNTVPTLLDFSHIFSQNFYFRSKLRVPVVLHKYLPEEQVI